MNEIKCSVKKCHYNENESCTAKCIEVCNCNCHQADIIEDQTKYSAFSKC